ncbi:hypothetical protein DV738_g732, partial [Chaetothyriales sp. CBS 135597]
MQSVRAGPPRALLQQLFCAPGQRAHPPEHKRAQGICSRRRYLDGRARCPDWSPEPPAPPVAAKPLSLSQRLKKLSREYGWAAVGVYFALSALDFPFCFLAVRTLGTDRIGHWEHVIVTTVKDWLAWPIHAVEGDESSSNHHHHSTDPSDDDEHVDHGYKEAEAANRGSNASIWTQLALAYAIHKSFIFIRVPLTAAVTPKVVKTLRGWGWNIGSMSKRGPKKVD